MNKAVRQKTINRTKKPQYEHEEMKLRMNIPLLQTENIYFTKKVNL